MEQAVDRKLVILPWKEQILTAVYEDDKLAEIFVDPPGECLLGGIYVAKVVNVVKNINAAFVEIAPGQRAYYSLTENTRHIFTNTKKDRGKLVAGDEILVQVSKEAMKTKPPMVTSAIHLPGQSLILAVGKSFVGISSKITREEERSRLKALVQPRITRDYGFIIRTQAAACQETDIQQEADKLCGLYDRMCKKAAFCPPRTKVYGGWPTYFKYIQSHPHISRITTDIPQVYEEIKGGLAQMGLDIPLSLYTDTSWPLEKVYSIPTQLERALSPQVWLKSGGYLMIQPTEAMVVIDVNTGKYSGKKGMEETFFKINMEAAGELARQLRLRNLSGIIIVDFIDMKEAAKRRELESFLKSCLARDSVKTVYVDSTKLNLVELTRKKERRPLHELLGRAK